MNVDDRDVERFLLQLTLLPVAEVREHRRPPTAPGPQERLAQRRLAAELTTIVHGEPSRRRGRRGVGGPLRRRPRRSRASARGRWWLPRWPASGAPTAQPIGDGVDPVAVLVAAGSGRARTTRPAGSSVTVRSRSRAGASTKATASPPPTCATAGTSCSARGGRAMPSSIWRNLRCRVDAGCRRRYVGHSPRTAVPVGTGHRSSQRRQRPPQLRPPEVRSDSNAPTERSCGQDQPPRYLARSGNTAPRGDCHKSSLKTEERNDVRVRAIALTSVSVIAPKVFAPVIFEFLKFGLPKTMDKK